MSAATRLIAYRPPRIAMLLVLLAGLVHLLMPLPMYQFPASFDVAVVVGGGGGGFCSMLWAWWQFKKQGTAICPTATTTVLISNDIFAFSRNPMYLGMLMMLLALGIGSGAMSFYFAAFLYFCIISYAFCPYEERKLTQLFGDDFVSYQNNVRRWI
jgi:protein-S-isoprenylcysteine O-methyltransferase Ste14